MILRTNACSLRDCMRLDDDRSASSTSATEAPAGFDTPTLQTQNAGSQSSSNGIPEPAGDTFARDQQIFEKREDASLGLGPFSTPRPARSVIRTPSAAAPVKSRKFV
jgi:hypothetical protein